MPRIMLQEDFLLDFSQEKKLISLVCIFLKLTQWSFWRWLQYFPFSSSQISMTCQRWLTSAIQEYQPSLLVPLDAAHLITWIFMSEVNIILIQYCLFFFQNPFTEHRCLGDILSKDWDKAAIKNLILTHLLSLNHRPFNTILPYYCSPRSKSSCPCHP